MAAATATTQTHGVSQRVPDQTIVRSPGGCRAWDSGLVKRVGEFDESRIATRAHIGNNAANGLRDIVFLCAVGVQKRFELRGEARRTGIETACHVSCLRASAGHAPPKRR